MLFLTARRAPLLILSLGLLLLPSGCDDTKIYDILASTADIPAGSADCLAGGTRIDYGYDDGSGDGEREDGVLHADEVTTSQLICHDDANAPAVAQQAPAGPVGTNRIDVSGGAGSVGSGGSAGGVLFPPGTGGSSFYIFRTGSALANVTLPAFDVDLGALPVEVTSDTTLTELPGSPADGVYYEDISATLVVVSGGAPSTATGLHVASGVTLTLPAVADNTVSLFLEDDMHLEGTLSAGGSGLSNLQLNVNDFWSAAGSRVELASGAAQVASLSLYARGSLASGSAVDGHLDGTTGLPGAQVSFTTEAGPMVQTGSIDVRGEEHTSGVGGPGGAVSLNSAGALGLGADLLAMGGQGTDGGGSGGPLFLLAGARFSGSLSVAASLDSGGGVGTGPASFGGGAAPIQMLAVGGDTTLVGEALAEGGDGGAAGGDGAPINFQTVMGSLPTGPSFAAKQMRIDADVRATGGDGEAGGQGGSLTALLDSFGAGSVVFYGVEQIRLDGGAAGAMGGGGAGGYVSLMLPPAQMPLGVGAVVLRTEIMARGGARGGLGGSITVVNEGGIQDWNGSLSPEVPTLVIEGDLDATSGVDLAAGSGSITLRTAREMLVDGSLTVRGGESRDDMDPGGSGGRLMLTSFAGPVTVNGSLDARGADGQDGGSGGQVSVGASQTTISGDVLASGGGGVTNGGGGGSVEVASSSGLSEISGAVDVAGGAGGSGVDGPEGFAFVDSF